MEEGVTIGIAVAAVLAFLGVVTCSLFWWRFKRWRSSPDSHRPGTDCLLKIFKCVDIRCCPARATDNGDIGQYKSTISKNQCYINNADSASCTDQFAREGNHTVGTGSSCANKGDVTFDKVREAVDIGGITLVSVEESRDSGLSGNGASRYSNGLYPEPESPIRQSAQGYVEVDLRD